MSIDRSHSQIGSSGLAGPAGMAATPGKRTQVELALETAGLGAAPSMQLSATGSQAHPEVAGQHPEAASAPSPSGVNLTTLKAFIAKHEGNVGHVYLDSLGNPTAGIGHLLPRGQFQVGQQISAAQIDTWFRSDVAKAIAGARSDIGSAYDQLDEARKTVVIDMVFNLGAGGFHQFHATIGAIQRGAYAEAADDMLRSRWASQVGHRAQEDAAIMRSGHMAGGGGTGGGGTGGGSHGGHAGQAPALSAVRDGHGVLKIGETGPAVAAVQRDLHITADGIFGSHTQQAVEHFQRAHHLAVDGIVGRNTLHALEHKPASGAHGAHAPALSTVRDGHGVIKIGETGSAVAAVQRDLHITTDGIFGAHTRHAVERFQHAHHLAVDGVVGRNTLHALEHRPASGGGSSHASALGAVRDGHGVLKLGARGAAVAELQRDLHITADGIFGPDTRHAVERFQRAHGLAVDGIVGRHTLQALEHGSASEGGRAAGGGAAQGGGAHGESHNGAAQRQRLLSTAQSRSAGQHPDGMCYHHVKHFIKDCGGYGTIRDPYKQFPSADQPFAHDFADLMNSRGPRSFGLDRVSIGNPYDAPAGSIVVVAAGSPGTHHPTAGDISVADGHGGFFNGGEMHYGGRAGWNASRRARLLGCYIPV